MDVTTTPTDVREYEVGQWFLYDKSSACAPVYVLSIVNYDDAGTRTWWVNLVGVNGKAWARHPIKVKASADETITITHGQLLGLIGSETRAEAFTPVQKADVQMVV